jgi:hypothetical protein
MTLPLDRRALGQPQLESIAHSQCGAPSTLRNLWMFFNPATKLSAKLPDKGRVVVPRDRKAIDSSLTLNSSCLLFHLIAHFALPDRAGVYCWAKATSAVQDSLLCRLTNVKCTTRAWVSIWCPPQRQAADNRPSRVSGIGVGSERETSAALRWTTNVAPPFGAKTTTGYLDGMHVPFHA